MVITNSIQQCNSSTQHSALKSKSELDIPALALVSEPKIRQLNLNFTTLKNVSLDIIFENFEPSQNDPLCYDSLSPVYSKKKNIRATLEKPQFHLNTLEKCIQSGCFRIFLEKL